MSAQILSAKSTRRLARELNEPTITRAWVDNETDHQVVLFATWPHEHGWYDRRTRNWGYVQGAQEVHAVHCYGSDGALLLDLDPFDDDGRWPTLLDTNGGT